MDDRDRFRIVLLLSGKYNLPRLEVDWPRLERDIDQWMKSAPDGIKIDRGEIVDEPRMH